MGSRRTQTYTEATLPPTLRIPFDRWSPLKDRRGGTVRGARLEIPDQWLGYRAWLEIIDDKCAGGSCDEYKLDGPWGGWLLFAEKVGQGTIAAWSGLGTRAAVIRRGRISRVAEIRMPRSFQLNSNAWFVWSRLSAVRTAELAVLTLRERTAPRRRDAAGDAWLRRQLEGLGA